MANVIRTPSILDQGYLFLGRFSQAGANFRDLPKIFSIGNFKNNPVFIYLDSFKGEKWQRVKIQLEN